MKDGKIRAAIVIAAISAAVVVGAHALFSVDEPLGISATAYWHVEDNGQVYDLEIDIKARTNGEIVDYRMEAFDPSLSENEIAIYNGRERTVYLIALDPETGDCLARTKIENVGPEYIPVGITAEDVEEMRKRGVGEHEIEIFEGVYKVVIHSTDINFDDEVFLPPADIDFPESLPRGT
ncbi:MAG: hypothetical protein J7J17_00545 [Hadesarchaea archaeon]|nr:hypothetical protein [Hadesarchaea archaeon]